MLEKVTLAVCFLIAILGRGGCNSCLHPDWTPSGEGESCYGFGESRVTWGDAQEFCRSLGANLAEIETPAEKDFLKNQVRNRAGGEYWLGGSDVFREGSWIWMSSWDLVVYTDWDKGEPSDTGSGGEDCLALSESHNYQWNDWPCDSKYNFICEISSNASMTK